MIVGSLRTGSVVYERSKQYPLIAFVCGSCWGNGCFYCEHRGHFHDPEHNKVAKCEVCNESLSIYSMRHIGFCSEDCRKHDVPMIPLM